MIEGSVIADAIPLIIKSYPDPEFPHLLPLGYSMDRKAAIKEALLITGVLMDNEDQIGCLGCWWSYRAKKVEHVCRSTKLSLKHRIWYYWLAELDKYNKIGLGHLAKERRNG